jgi:hypothetical protein
MDAMMASFLGKKRSSWMRHFEWRKFTVHACGYGK